MTIEEALARVQAAREEVRRLRLWRWNQGWPPGHADREAMRPAFAGRSADTAGSEADPGASRGR